MHSGRVQMFIDRTCHEVFRHLSFVRCSQGGLSGWSISHSVSAADYALLAIDGINFAHRALRLMPDDAAETDVAHPGVDWLRVACGGAIAATIVGGAEV